MIDFETMVQLAIRWRAATFDADRMLEAKGATLRQRLANSRMTTKGDMDAYLMRVFGVDECVARSVSNELTSRNSHEERMHVSPEEFASEPWAKVALEMGGK